MKNLSGGTLALVMVGALAVLFACAAGSWWIAHQMAWWTFASLSVGASFGTSLVKAIFKRN